MYYDKQFNEVRDEYSERIVLNTEQVAAIEKVIEQYEKRNTEKQKKINGKPRLNYKVKCQFYKGERS